MTQVGVPELLPTTPYTVLYIDLDSLFELMQEYFKNHTPVEAYIHTGNKDEISYIMGFVDEEPVRVLHNECNIAVKIRGTYYPACNVRPKMITFREADEDGHEYFIERNKHPAMTHQEMMDVAKKALKESEIELAKLKDLESFSGHTFKETKQHEQLIEIWKKNIKWNQDALDRGDY